MVLKGLSIAPLALLAIWKRQWLLASALAFGSFGDVLLEVKPEMFPAGLAAFLVGHVFYMWLFTRSRPKPFHWTRTQLALVIALVLFATAMSVYLIPSVGMFAPAVVAYMIALVCMAITAVAMQLPEPWVVIGAVLFVMSDSILAVSKFKTPVPARELLVWWTYYFGQMGIAIGFLRVQSRKSP